MDVAPQIFHPLSTTSIHLDPNAPSYIHLHPPASTFAHLPHWIGLHWMGWDLWKLVCYWGGFKQNLRFFYFVQTTSNFFSIYANRWHFYFDWLIYSAFMPVNPNDVDAAGAADADADADDGWTWMKVDAIGWNWMTMNKSEWKWMKVV